MYSDLVNSIHSTSTWLHSYWPSYFILVSASATWWWQLLLKLNKDVPANLMVLCTVLVVSMSNCLVKRLLWLRVESDIFLNTAKGQITDLQLWIDWTLMRRPMKSKMVPFELIGEMGTHKCRRGRSKVETMWRMVGWSRPSRKGIVFTMDLSWRVY